MEVDGGVREILPRELKVRDGREGRAGGVTRETRRR